MNKLLRIFLLVGLIFGMFGVVKAEEVVPPDIELPPVKIIDITNSSPVMTFFKGDWWFYWTSPPAGTQYSFGHGKYQKNILSPQEVEFIAPYYTYDVSTDTFYWLNFSNRKLCGWMKGISGEVNGVSATVLDNSWFLFWCKIQMPVIFNLW